MTKNIIKVAAIRTANNAIRGVIVGTAVLIKARRLRASPLIGLHISLSSSILF
jgi:hypothetical protein